MSKKRTLEAAAAYAEKQVCILNFASATNPGGGVTKGSSAQEEAICRCSTLYPNLKESWVWNKFYGPNRRQQDPLHKDDCIYTPGVLVFKSDTSYPKLLPGKELVFCERADLCGSESAEKSQQWNELRGWQYCCEYQQEGPAGTA